MRLPLLPLVTALTLVAPALVTSACGSSSSSTMSMAAPDNVTYVGTNDEALGMLLGTALKTGGTVTLLTPTATTFSVSSPPALGWSLGTLAAIPRAYPSFFGSVAFAHGTPVTGSATYMQLLDDAGNPIVAAFTTSAGYSLSNTEKAALASFFATKGAGARVSVELTSARFEDDRVIEGPFRAPTVTFTLVP